MLTPQKSPEFGLLKKFSKKLLAILFLVLTSSIGFSQCTAAFTAVDNGNGNYTFTNTSTGTTANTVYDWRNGTSFPFEYLGNSSTSFNHTFTNGTYNIQLVISVPPDSSNNGCWTIQSQTIIVTSGVSCSLSVSFIQTSGANGLQTFSSFGLGTWDFETWDFYDYFGNQTTIFGFNPSYVFPVNSWHLVCLTALNTNTNCFYTSCDSIYVPMATSIDEATNNIISNWSIYPNPFKEHVTIEFVLKDNSAVEIFATDLIGNTVDVISNEMMQSGINNVKWNANKLSNGIYLVTIKTETSLQVKKVVLNR